MINPLDYVPAITPSDCKIRVSPSSFGYFIERPWMWYRQHVLGLDKFEYSTSSVIGTIVHYVAEQVSKGGKVDKKAIEAYIEKHEENDSYCKETVRSQWVYMSEVLVNNYVIPNDNCFFEAEEQVCTEIDKKIYASGTFDRLEGYKEDCMLCDYKSYNSKTKPKAITSVYRYQLLMYVWILRKLGYNVTRIRLIYINRYIDGGVSEKTGKPLKSYPPEVTVLTESVQEDDMIFIESQLKLCADKLEATEKYPELASVIWHDPRLNN